MLSWMDWLRTPMAAPETRGLKFMRISILIMCLVLIVSIAAIAPLRAAIGIWAGGLVGAVLVSLVMLVPVYVALKNRADDAYLDDMLAEQSE